MLYQASQNGWNVHAIVHSHRVYGSVGGVFVTSLIQGRLVNDTQNTVLCVQNFARNIHVWVFGGYALFGGLVFVCDSMYVTC